MTQIKEEILEETLLNTSNEHHLVLYNDDFNTFDYVIEQLVSVCQHTFEQAEQCAMIVHFNGKCVVKSGTLSHLIPKQKALNNSGLTAEIQ